jgi:hypothetical protein
MGVLVTEEMLAAKFGTVLPHLDERQRRLVLGAEARVLGHGGIRLVARAAGVREATVSRGVAELEAGVEPLGRARRPGGGRKRAADTDPGLVPALLALVEPDERGDPVSPLRWTTKSTRKLAAELAGQGHAVSADTVAGLLRGQGFSLQGNAKVIEGRAHPDRDAQFRHIAGQAGEYMAAGDPVISVDTKKRELVGQYASGGREWRPRGEPVRVRDHDFPDPARGTAIPYGIYDLAANAGWVNVGTDHDTAAFAVESIRRWWNAAGKAAYPAARRLLVTADAGGSNSYRTRAWKAELAAFALESGLAVAVCHFPPGTSKWNKIEHRLFSAITLNWRGRPLTSHEVIVQTIAATTTAGGLTVHAALDPGSYPHGATVSDEQMAALPLDRHNWHGDWNYTLRPAPPRPAPAAPPGPSPAARPGRPRLSQDTLAHPALTGIPRPSLDHLLTTLALPWTAQREARRYTQRGGPRRNAPGATGRPLLDYTDHILLTLIRQHLGLPQHVLARLAGTHPDTISAALSLTRPILTTPLLPATTPHHRLRTLTDLTTYAAAAGITIPPQINTAC